MNVQWKRLYIDMIVICFLLYENLNVTLSKYSPIRSRIWNRTTRRKSFSKSLTSSTMSILNTGATGPTTLSSEKIFPYNLFQYYETPTPASDSIEFEFIRHPEGKDPIYYPPNITAEERKKRLEFVKGRANKTDWCRCGFCPAQNNDEDSVCCRDDYYFNFYYEKLGNMCYAESAFTSQYLRIHILNDYRLYFVGKRKLEAKYKLEFTNTLSQELWRWLAYRLLIRVLNFHTPYTAGRFNGTIPACVVHAVREEFPDPDNEYKPTGWSMFGPIRMPN